MPSPRFQANRGCASTQTLNRPTSICKCVPSRASSTLVAAVSHRATHSKVGASLLANAITSVPGEPRLCIDSDFEPAYQHLQMRAQSRQFTLDAAVSQRETHSKVGASLLANGITSVTGEPRLCINSDFETAYQHLQMRAQSRQFNAGRSGLPEGNAFQGGSEPAREWHDLGSRRTEVVHRLRL